MGLGLAIERRLYIVTSLFIGWAHTEIDPCVYTNMAYLKVLFFCSIPHYNHINMLPYATNGYQHLLEFAMNISSRH